MGYKHSPFRCIVAGLMLLPALMFGGLQLMARPDLETWLAARTRGFARPDAFAHVTAISYYFIALFGLTSLFAAYLVLSRRSQFLVPLAVGPLMTSLVYLAAYGITDPNWYALLALLGIGMLVGSLVTALWIALTETRHTKR